MSSLHRVLNCLSFLHLFYLKERLIIYFSCGDGVIFRSRLSPAGLCYNSMASTVVSVSETVAR